MKVMKLTAFLAAVVGGSILLVPSPAVSQEQTIPTAKIFPYSCNADKDPEVKPYSLRWPLGMPGNVLLSNSANKGESGYLVKFEKPIQLSAIRCNMYVAKPYVVRLVIAATDRKTKQSLTLAIPFFTGTNISPGVSLTNPTNYVSYFQEITVDLQKVDLQQATVEKPAPKRELADLDIRQIGVVEENEKDRKTKSYEYYKVQLHRLGDPAGAWMTPGSVSVHVVNCSEAE
jgi:hypothetical protein